MAGEQAEVLTQEYWDSLSPEEQEALGEDMKVADVDTSSSEGSGEDTGESAGEGSGEDAGEGAESTANAGESESGSGEEPGSGEESGSGEGTDTTGEQSGESGGQDEEAGTAETETSAETGESTGTGEEGTEGQGVDQPLFAGDTQSQDTGSEGTSESGEGEEGAEQRSETAQRLEQIPEEISQLNQQFDDGEIGFTEYLDKRDALRQEQTRLEVLPEVEKTYEQRRQEEQQQSLEQQWRNDVTNFTQNDAPDMLQDIDTYNKWVELTNAKLDNPDYDNMSNQQILDEAAKETRAIRGLPQPGQQEREKSEASRAAEARKGANQSRKSEAEQTQSLSGVPEAAASEGSPDKFTYLDQLMENDPEKFEAEVAKLSETERDEYARR